MDRDGYASVTYTHPILNQPACSFEGKTRRLACSVVSDTVCHGSNPFAQRSRPRQALLVANSCSFSISREILPAASLFARPFLVID